MLIKQFKEEYEYLYEYLETSLEISHSLIEIAEKCIYHSEADFQEIAEHNLFYLDSAKFSINNILNILSEVRFETLAQKNKKNVVLYLDNSDDDIWVDINYKIPEDFYVKNAEKSDIKLKLIENMSGDKK